jgi:hypothetical protein
VARLSDAARAASIDLAVISISIGTDPPVVSLGPSHEKTNKSCKRKGRRNIHSCIFANGHSHRDAARCKTGQADMLIIANAIANSKSPAP